MNNKNRENENQTTRNKIDDEGSLVSDQGQNLGGGKTGRTIDVGEKNDGNEFSKTDQSIAQAAPGQMATAENQGGSNA